MREDVGMIGVNFGWRNCWLYDHHPCFLSYLLQTCHPYIPKHLKNVFNFTYVCTFCMVSQARHKHRKGFMHGTCKILLFQKYIMYSWPWVSSIMDCSAIAQTLRLSTHYRSRKRNMRFLNFTPEKGRRTKRAIFWPCPKEVHHTS